MKTIFFYIFSLSLCGGLKAQTRPLSTYPANISQNAYYKDTEGLFQPYLGEWIYQDSVVVFKLKFQKAEYILNEGSIYQEYVDFLVMSYTLTVNGQLITDTSNFPTMQKGFANVRLPNNAISVVFKDIEKSKPSEATLTLSDAVTNSSGIAVQASEATWKVAPVERWVLPGSSAAADGYSFPINVTMVKVP